MLPCQVVVAVADGKVAEQRRGEVGEVARQLNEGLRRRAQHRRLVRGIKKRRLRPRHLACVIHWESMIARSAGRLVGWSAGRLVGRSAGRLVGWSAGRLVGWSAGRLVGWSVGWPGGWLVVRAV